MLAVCSGKLIRIGGPLSLEQVGRIERSLALGLSTA